MTSPPENRRRAISVRRVRWIGPDQVAMRLAVPASSARFSLRPVKVCACLLAATVLLGAANLSFGVFSVPLTRVVPSLLGHGDPASSFVVQELRLPRTVAAVLVGLAFGMAGAIFQSLTRNPLGSPDVLGVESGAAAGAVFVIVAARGTRIGTAGGALVGGLTAAFAVYALGYRRGGASGYRLILLGTLVAAALNAATSYLLVRANVNQAQEAARWLSGSLSARGWDDLAPVGAALLAMLPLAPAVARQLGALQLGDDTAGSLGVRVASGRASLLLVGTILAAAATATAGPVLFVALVAPQLARRLAGTTTAALAPAACVGAALTCAADLTGRLIIAPTELPVGVVTAIVGAPYLLWFLSRSSRDGE